MDLFMKAPKNFNRKNTDASLNKDSDKYYSETTISLNKPECNMLVKTCLSQIMNDPYYDRNRFGTEGFVATPANDNMPDWRNVFNRVIIGLSKSCLDVWTTEILPLASPYECNLREQSSITETFDNVEPQLTPTFGNTPLSRVRLERNTTVAHTYSIGFEIENSFLKYNESGSHLVVTHLQNASQTATRKLSCTIYSTLLKAALERSPQEFDTRSLDTYKRSVEEFISNSFVFNKRVNPLAFLIQTIGDKMESGPAQARLTHVIIPHGKFSLLCTGNSSLMDYSSSGSMAPKRYKDGLSRDDTSLVVGGVRIISAPQLNAPSDATYEKNDSLSSSIITATFHYFLTDPAQDITKELSWKIYDNYSSCLSVFRYENFLQKNPRFKRNSKGGYELKTYNELVLEFDFLTQDIFMDDPFFTENIDVDPSKKKNVPWIVNPTFDKSKTVVEWQQLVEFIGMRPFETYLSQPILFIAGGGELGNSTHGMESINSAFNIHTDTVFFKMLFSQSAHLRSPWRVEAINHAIYNGNGKGQSSKIINSSTAAMYASNGFNLMSESDPAMYTMAVPRDGVIDKDGVFAGFETSQKFINLKGISPVEGEEGRSQYLGNKFYNAVYKFDNINNGNNQRYPIGDMLAKRDLWVHGDKGYIKIAGNSHHGDTEGDFGSSIREMRSTGNHTASQSHY
jgi:hypothetical protein